MNDDLISRQAVINTLYDMEIIKYRYEIEDAIKALPAYKPKGGFTKMTKEEIRRALDASTIDYNVSEEIMNLLSANPQPNIIKLTNRDWINFLVEQFDISRTSAKEMLHVMMRVKWEDNFKKQFSGRKGQKNEEKIL